MRYVDNISPKQVLVWTQGGGMQRLFYVLVANGATVTSGWRLDEATAISADGKWVVGRASGPSGHSQAFLANIEAAVVPVPPVVWLFGSALGVMGCLQRKVGRR